MKTIILMIGISGSGKSTYIDDNLFNCQLLSADDIKDAIGGEFYTTWAYFNSKKRYREVSAISAVMKTNCEALMKRGRPIVVDDLNIDKPKIVEWAELAKKYNYQIEAVILKTPLFTCISRRKDEDEVDLEDMLERFNNLISDPELSSIFDIIREDI